jgi:hypothetical protein
MTIEDCFGHNRTRRIVVAQEKDVIDFVGHASSPWQRGGRAFMTVMCRELSACHGGWMTGHSRIPPALQAGSYFFIFAFQRHALLISGHASVLTPPGRSP